MAKVKSSVGFTVVEMIVTLGVLSVFLAVSFQIFSTTTSQQTAVARRAAAYDIAVSNLGKITSKAGLPACTSAINGLLNPTNDGRIIASNQPSRTPTWSAAAAIAGATTGIEPESLVNTPLPNGSTYQELRVSYPQGCDSRMPVTILSIVTYGSESVRRASYVN